MGTVIEYTIRTPDRDDAQAAMLRAQEEIERIERLFAEGDSTSEIFRFNHSTRGIVTKTEVYHGVLRALEYYRKTNGTFDVTMKPVLDLYGFQSNESPPSDDLIQRALAHVGADKLKLTQHDEDQSWQLGKAMKEVRLSMGGFIKGYAVDRAIQVLRENGITNGIINAGGDLYCLGGKNGEPWKVGVQHPRKPGETYATLNISNLAVATSGDYQRYYLFEGVRYHHLLDPQTGKPSRKARSATVISRTTEEADAWATALCILDPEEGLRLVNAMADVFGMIVDSSGTIHYSEDMHRFLWKIDTLSTLSDNTAKYQDY